MKITKQRLIYSIFKNTILLVIISNIVSCSSQSKLEKKADEAFNRGEYFAASDFYELS